MGHKDHYRRMRETRSLVPAKLYGIAILESWQATSVRASLASGYHGVEVASKYATGRSNEPYRAMATACSIEKKG